MRISFARIRIAHKVFLIIIHSRGTLVAAVQVHFYGFVHLRLLHIVHKM